MGVSGNCQTYNDYEAKEYKNEFVSLEFCICEVFKEISPLKYEARKYFLHSTFSVLNHSMLVNSSRA